MKILFGRATTELGEGGVNRLIAVMRVASLRTKWSSGDLRSRVEKKGVLSAEHNSVKEVKGKNKKLFLLMFYLI